MKQHYACWLLIVMLASRLTFKYFFGLEFDSAHLWIGWQIIDPLLLRTQLLQSIWYLHSQPPLYNLMLGIVLKLFPVHYAAVLEWSYLLLGLIQSQLLYRTLVMLTARPARSFWITLLLAVSPAFVLYEHWLFYTFPGMCLLSISTYLLLQFLRSRRPAWGLAFFTTLAVLALSISMFHWVWLLMITGGLLLWQRHMRRSILLTAAGPLLLVSAWYVKNLVLFGSFTASTWFGMNISRIMLLPATELQQPNLQLDSLTRRVVYEGPFRPVASYGILPYHGPLQQVPVLQQTCKSNGCDNYNNINYIQVSSRFRQGALRSLQYHTGHYLHSVLVSNALYFSPASEYFHLKKNRERIHGYNALFNLGDVRLWHGYIGIMNILLAGLTAIVLPAALLLCLRHKRSSLQPGPVVMAYALFNILFVLCAGNLLEIGENMRFRFMTVPLFLLLTVTLLFTRRSIPAS